MNKYAVTVNSQSFFPYHQESGKCDIPVQNATEYYVLLWHLRWHFDTYFLPGATSIYFCPFESTSGSEFKMSLFMITSDFQGKHNQCHYHDYEKFCFHGHMFHKR